jgi:hypothetical protein
MVDGSKKERLINMSEEKKSILDRVTSFVRGDETEVKDDADTDEVVVDEARAKSPMNALVDASNYCHTSPS